ncbi:MAG TPA: M13 family metallopeptidase [Caulobacteraceae bacterium]
MTKRPRLTATACAAALALAQAAAAAPQIKPWGFGLDGRDTQVSPGADFYQYADGTYVKKLAIPADRSRFGVFDGLAQLSEDRVYAILQKAAADRDPTGEGAKIGAFYRAFMDEDRANALGAKPAADDLAAIRAATSKEDIAAIMGRGVDGFYGSVFDVSIGVDAKDPGHYGIYLGQAGLSLPNRDYYIDPTFAPQKAAYQAYVAKMLGLIGWPDADAQARAIVDMETQIAQASWTLAEERDATKEYNPMSVTELDQAAPGFDWGAFLKGAQLGAPARVIVGENTAFPKLAAIFAATPLATLKAWEAFNVADQAGPYLSKPFVDAEFEFRNKTLSGQQQLKPRWKRAVSVVNGDMGEAVGRLYVAAYFPPDAKAKVDALVANIRSALAARIQTVSWMSDETKGKALLKLSKLNVKIGYPATWRDYSSLAVDEADLYGDVKRASAFEWLRQVHRLGGPVDRTEWRMTPQTVNAYYDSTQNEIVFPAAILQPPFFDPAADMAVNYGGIGAVIGHEMTHGFDDQGRQFDGDGRLADWWTPGDSAKFDVQAKRLGDQYSAFQPLPGVHVKGDQTMGENIADLGGVLLALDAYHMSLGGKSAPTLSGFTGDQRLFLGFAQDWRSAIRPDALKRQVVSDVHAPDMDRVNGVVRNVDAWYAAWNIKPTDPLYIAPDQRVRIW